MDYMHERIIMLAEYICENHATVRETAGRFGISKSTVHKDMTVRLKAESPSLYEKVRYILDRNKAERHVRGGEATKRKYQILRHLRAANLK